VEARGIVKIAFGYRQLDQSSVMVEDTTLSWPTSLDHHRLDHKYISSELFDQTGEIISAKTYDYVP
jgi:hypothetical protein